MDTPVIGVSFDGTGYGTDGTIWGVDSADSAAYGVSWDNIEPFQQAGGDKASNRLWAVAMLYALTGSKEQTASTWSSWPCTPQELTAQFFYGITRSTPSAALVPAGSYDVISVRSASADAPPSRVKPVSGVVAERWQNHSRTS